MTVKDADCDDIITADLSEALACIPSATRQWRHCLTERGAWRVPPDPRRFCQTAAFFNTPGATDTRKKHDNRKVAHHKRSTDGHTHLEGRDGSDGFDLVKVSFHNFIHFKSSWRDKD